MLAKAGAKRAWLRILGSWSQTDYAWRRETGPVGERWATRVALNVIYARGFKARAYRRGHLAQITVGAFVVRFNDRPGRASA